MEKYSIAGKEYQHMLPYEMDQIVTSLMAQVTDNTESLDFEAFKKFLNLNPTVRSIILESLHPRLWTVGSHLPKAVLMSENAKLDLKKSLILERRKSKSMSS